MSNTAEKMMSNTSDVVITLDNIQRLIPHRYPFLMVEKVIDVVPGERATGVKNVSINEPYFMGHFPQKPVMPGVMLVEALAQTAGILVMHTLGHYDRGTLVYFMSIEEAKFRKMVQPGDVVHLEVEKIHQRGPVWKFKGRAKVNGEVVAEATKTAMIDERKQ